MRKFLFLVNAFSGGPAGKKIKESILSELSGMLARDEYDIEFTEVDIARQVKDASPGYETVVVVGGDGTIHQAVQGIVGLGNKPKVGIIPTGTGNDLARSLGILPFFKSHGLRALLELILKGKTTQIDIISLNGKYFFTNYFSMGNDAKISNYFNRVRVIPFLRSRILIPFNKALYGIIGLTKGFYKIPFDIELKYRSGQSTTEMLTVHGGTCEVILTNAKTYAAGALLSSKCRMDDGKFEVTVISSTWQWIMMHFTRFSKRPLNVLCPKLIQFQTDMLEMTFTGDTFYQIDGEIPDAFPEGKKSLIVRIESHIEMIIT
jgi:YegS/Rv2252/BmrU family lipid kinase